MATVDSFDDRQVLITGGLGFIGSTLANRLVELGACVTLVDSLIPQYGGNPFNVERIKDKVTINVSDVRDQYAMNYLVQGKDYIFNLAGTLSHVDSMKDPFTDLEINCRSQLAILESCRLYNPNVKILFAGTRGQYGRADYLPVDEKHLMHPTDVNGINNMAGEWYHILYNNVYGIRATSLRLTNTYGPRHQMKHPRQGIINWFVRLVIDEEPINIFGDGRQIRDTNYVDDVVEAFLLAAISEKSNGEVFNLGGYPAGLVEIVETLIDIYGKGSYRLVPFPQNSKAIEIGDYIADWRKMRETLGWEPKMALREGLQRTLEYYVEHRHNYWQKGVVM